LLRPADSQNEVTRAIRPLCEAEMNPDSTHHSRRSMPAAQLPTKGFMGRGRYARDLLTDLVSRINSGNLAHLKVPSALVYRWAVLCSRWSPDLQMFVAQVLERTSNIDHFLTQPAALDHHHHTHGLLEAAITAAELALNADHDNRSFQPLPRKIDELQQVCSAVAFLFDIGKVFDSNVGKDKPRATRGALLPYSDLSRCWRTSWDALAQRNALLAEWVYQIARETADPSAAVRAARSLTHHAVKAAWALPQRR
jgi:hypothetical protein